jgi:hypothetical protein
MPKLKIPMKSLPTGRQAKSKAQILTLSSQRKEKNNNVGKKQNKKVFYNLSLSADNLNRYS